MRKVYQLVSDIYWSITMKFIDKYGNLKIGLKGVNSYGEENSRDNTK